MDTSGGEFGQLGVKLAQEYAEALKTSNQVLLSSTKSRLLEYLHQSESDVGARMRALAQLATEAPMLGGVRLDRDLFRAAVEYVLAYAASSYHRSAKRALLNLLVYGKHKYGYTHIMPSEDVDCDVFKLLQPVPESASIVHVECLCLGGGAFGEVYAIKLREN
jgi:hypothetical protein